MHMVQHILIGDIAPLLVLLSLSRVIMRPLTRRLQSASSARSARSRTRPPASCSGSALMYVWHIPAMYDAALEHPGVHALEHACFFAGRDRRLVAADPARADAPPR